MASTSVTCISSILDDLQALENDCPEFPDGQQKYLKRMLRYLRTFLLCARKYSNDDVQLPFDNKMNQADNHYASLEALAVRIGDAIPKWAKEIPSSDQPWDAVHDLEKDIKSFEQEICEWYAFFLGSSSQQSTNSVVRQDDLMEFMDSLLENLVNYWSWMWPAHEVGLIKALEEKLAFMKNFIRFIKLYGVENTELGPLLVHTEAVAINAARLSYKCQFKKGFGPPKDVEESISELLQKIVPVEPQVLETCIQALTASKLSRQSYGDAEEHLLRDFFNSLSCNLWETLKHGTCPVILQQLQMFYEGLNSLRTILVDKPKMFDEKVRDPTRVVNCYGGDFISPLSLNAIKDAIQAKDMDLVCSELLGIIKLIDAKITEKCPESSSFNFPKTNGLGFVDSLLEKMMDVTSSEAGSIALIDHPIQKVLEELDCLRSLLRKIVELHNEDEDVQAIWNRIVGVAYRIEFLIDSLITGNILDSSSMSIHSILEEMNIIKAAALKICDSERLGGKVKEVTKRFNHMPQEGSKPIVNDVVVGFEDETASIINQLRNGSRQVRIVSIVGMPGCGKTTLARKVYNDSSVKSHFYERAWCTVSQIYQKRNLLLQILTCIESKLPEDVFKMGEEDLALQVKRHLLKNRYLIVLDDVWDIDAWNGLEASFPDDGNGSRVILTSRLRGVAPQDKLDHEPYSLPQLTPNETWDLLKGKLYPGQDLAPPELCEIRQQVVEMCQGLPLTVVILAGILSRMDRYGWKEAVEGLSSRNVSSTEQCTATLELSYKHLPDTLKACFLYFGGFPEDHEHNTKRLISLWVAEGFVQKNQPKRLEDVANDYLMELIGRSLVTVSKPRSIDGVKACRIHDLLYEFCVTKAKEENFSRLVRRDDKLSDINVPCYLRRLCIDSNPEHFDKLGLFAPAIRRLLFLSSGMGNEVYFDFRFIFHIIKLVTVLDLSQIGLDPFPRELELLVHLRYLAILGQGKLDLPPSICNLPNLETLIWRNSSFHCSVSLPDTIWNLKKLRHLELISEGHKYYCFFFPSDNLDNSSQLRDLDFLACLSLDPEENISKLLRKFPNIRKLRCSVNLKPDVEHHVAMDCLSQLESLSLSRVLYGYQQFHIDFQFPLSIKRLTLTYFGMPWRKMAAIGNLPNLEVLKLLEEAFEGEIWEMEAEKFPNVRFLKLASLNIVKWTASSEYEYEDQDYFPRLQKLVLESCDALQEIPSCLGNSSTLEIIEVSKCPNCTSSLEEIQEEQRSNGYTDLKILIS
ncbi:putative late blight resistance protein homolog R1A-3 [Coffea arabica]|uniref:Late blight resistance protein homolog R1B-14 n=1 Tax=Coffea arabica TaxID=13443 RepID=A0A6P6S9R4_COFAR|nr:putative late blight resistance protein homolog R1B-14 [Coffea arabica]XP_027062227.1 putative late blight resistance protein homolog R1B-14 [Coffea arabica]